MKQGWRREKIEVETETEKARQSCYYEGEE
jgi:hypothetical protein